MIVDGGNVLQDLVEEMVELFDIDDSDVYDEAVQILCKAYLRGKNGCE